MTHTPYEVDRLVTLSVPVPASVRNRVKAFAALHGETMQDLVLRAVLRELGTSPGTDTAPSGAAMSRPRPSLKTPSQPMTDALREFIAAECRTKLPAMYYVEAAALRAAFVAHPLGAPFARTTTPVGFGRALSSAYPQAGASRARIDGRNVHVYRGLCLNADFPRF